MDAIMKSIEEVYTLIERIKSEDKKSIMVNIGELADIIGKTINDKNIWTEYDLNKF